MEGTVRRLTRSTRERVFAGVCGGAAAYLGIDPALTRIVFVAITLITGVGPGVLVYLAAWALVPESDGTRVTSSTTGNRRIMAFMLLAIGLLGLGVATILREENESSAAFLGPIVVIVLAAVLLAKKGDATANLDTYTMEGTNMSGESSEPRRLLRTANDKKIAGICGGFGSYFKVDPTLVRVLWILAVFLSAGVALLLYLILWIVMPLDIDPDTLSSRST